MFKRWSNQFLLVNYRSILSILTGAFRQVPRPNGNIAIRNISPEFPVLIWNVNVATLAGGIVNFQDWWDILTRVFGPASKKDNILVHLAVEQHPQRYETSHKQDMRSARKIKTTLRGSAKRSPLCFVTFRTVGHVIRSH